MPFADPFQSPERSPARRMLLLSAALTLLLTSTGLVGCAARTVRHSIIERNAIEVDLVRQVRGFTTEKKEYEHPAIISVPRLRNILGAIEVEVKADGEGMIRQPAFHEDIVDRTAEALAEGLSQASPDEEVAVKSIRKERKLGVFHTKYLTSFLARVENGQLYLSLRRIDWPIPQSEEKEPLPDPRRGRRVMNFRVVSGDPIYFAGTQDLEIDWRNDVFRTAFRLPGSTKGEKRRREVLDSIPVPKEELAPTPGASVGLDQLTAEQLRALADLEDDRRAGRITETTYQRSRRELLRAR